jgi:hypothetical protein
MKLSIKSLLADYAADIERTFEHDRSNTVGASDIGACLRKTGFAKNDTPPDPGYIDRYGAKLRGTLIEDHYWVPGIQMQLPFRGGFKLGGDEQRTIVDGYLSATPDGVLIECDRDCLAWLGIPDIGPSCCIAVECKSIDPRADLKAARAHHIFQVQVQMGLLREHTPYKPDFALISYIDASFLDEVSEFAIPFDPAVYDAAKARSTLIMSTPDPAALAPEGKLAGGAECGYCPWASRCQAVIVAGIPKGENKVLGDNAMAELKALRDRERELNADLEERATEREKVKFNIKEFLRANGVRRANGDGWSVSWSQTKGRETLDQKAAEAAGLDLAPYRKAGEPGDRLVVS